MLHEGGGRDLDNDVVEAQLEIGIELVNRRAHIRCAFHVDLAREKEMRDRSQRSDQTARNRPSHFAGWFVPVGRRTINGASFAGLRSRERAQLRS